MKLEYRWESQVRMWGPIELCVLDSFLIQRVWLGRYGPYISHPTTFSYHLPVTKLYGYWVAKAMWWVLTQMDMRAYNDNLGYVNQ